MLTIIGSILAFYSHYAHVIVASQSIFWVHQIQIVLTVDMWFFFLLLSAWVAYNEVNKVYICNWVSWKKCAISLHEAIKKEKKNINIDNTKDPQHKSNFYLVTLLYIFNTKYQHEFKMKVNESFAALHSLCLHCVNDDRAHTNQDTYNETQKKIII